MPGRLEVICGPMFAGKSTELIRRVRSSSASERTLHAFKPDRDTRSGHASLRTHAGDVIPAISVPHADQIITTLQAQSPHGQMLIAVDEIHFFGAALIAPVRLLVARGARVILAGVERDHRGLPFEPFPTLLCEADEVVKLTARCAVCGGEAIHSQRKTDSDAHIMVGGAEAYEARCRDCFRPAV